PLPEPLHEAPRLGGACDNSFGPGDPGHARGGRPPLPGPPPEEPRLGGACDNSFGPGGPGPRAAALFGAPRPGWWDSGPAGAWGGALGGAGGAWGGGWAGPPAGTSSTPWAAASAPAALARPSRRSGWQPAWAARGRRRSSAAAGEPPQTPRWATGR